MEDREIDLDTAHIPDQAPPGVPEIVIAARAPAWIDITRKESKLGRVQRLADPSRQRLVDRTVGDKDQVEVAHSKRISRKEMVQERGSAGSTDGQICQAELVAELRRDDREDRRQLSDRDCLHFVHRGP